MDDGYALVRRCSRAGIRVVVATIVEPAAGGAPAARPGATLVVAGDGERAGSLGDAELEARVERDAAEARGSNATGLRRYGDVTVFLHVLEAPPRLVVVGAADVSLPLVRVAKVLGFTVTVCDARPAFATRERFPEADEVVADWPHRVLEAMAPALGPRDAVCVLTHDAKFDVPALVVALSTRAGYVGAMGSRRTNEDRVERLRAAGVSEGDLGRLMAPVGLDLGARSPSETAVAIAAEIVASRSGAPVPSLRDGSGPIHRLAPGEATRSPRAGAGRP